MSDPLLARLSKERPPIHQRVSDAFDWHFLIPLFVHEVKVAIIEAMDWIGQPLSAAELKLILRGSNWSLGTIAYHVSTLAESGVIQVTDERAVRGARETYYALKYARDAGA